MNKTGQWEGGLCPFYSLLFKGVSHILENF